MTKSLKDTELNNELTPAKQAKQRGLKSLKQVTELTGQSKETLGNWSKHKPQLFDVVLTGCIEKLKESDREAESDKAKTARVYIEKHKLALDEAARLIELRS